MDDYLASFTHLLGTSLFYQLAAVLIVSGLIGFVALKLRQPLIIAYIGVGLLAGPDMLNVIGEGSMTIDTLSALGIALLLFLVGLKLDTSLIRALGPVALVTGAAQVLLTTAMGIGIAHWLGFDLLSAAWIGIALAFSSTIIVVKLLSDSGAIESLYGKICLGILIVQDIAVILAMVSVAALGSEAGSLSPLTILMDVTFKVGVLIFVTIVFIRYCADPLTHGLAKAPELMVIFALGLAATMAAVCYALDLSKELGGLLAGVALASTPLRDVMAARLSSLRDFLLLFFFVGLGLDLNLDGMAEQIKPALALAAFVLIGKPLIIAAIMGFMGYRRRTGFLSGLTLCQISEFSMILIGLAAAAGQVGDDIVTIVTLVGIITITVSVYAMMYQEKIYHLLEKPLGLFERKQARFAENMPSGKKGQAYDVIIYGMGRFGLAMAREFQKQGASVLGIDFDPDAIKDARQHGIPALYGDAADTELPKSVPLHSAHTVVMAFPHHITGPFMPDIRRTLARTLRDTGYKGHIAATSHFRAGREVLVENGIDIVLCPFEDAASHGADQIIGRMQPER